jgi:hypothetical protein
MSETTRPFAPNPGAPELDGNAVSPILIHPRPLLVGSQPTAFWRAGGFSTLAPITSTVVLIGSPGVGKTRLVRNLRIQVFNEEAAPLSTTQSSVFCSVEETGGSPVLATAIASPTTGLTVAGGDSVAFAERMPVLWPDGIALSPETGIDVGITVYDTEIPPTALLFSWEYADVDT